MTFTTRSDDQPRKSDTSRSGAGGQQSGAKQRRNRRRRQAQAQHSRSETTTQTPKKRPNERAVAAVEKRNQATMQSKPAGVTVGKTTTEGTERKTSGRRRNNHRRSRSRATARKKNTQRNGNRNVNRSSYAEAKMPTRTETSAGGLVISGMAEAVREDGSVDLSKIYVALIGRLDRRGRLLWSMPKGHVEADEDMATTAEREVWEETGIYGEVFAKLGVIDYWFVSDGTRIHKTVHHHLLRYVDGQLNDEDPEVTEVSWIPASALIEHFAYADERKLARVAHVTMPEYARKELAEGRITPR